MRCLVVLARRGATPKHHSTQRGMIGKHSAQMSRLTARRNHNKMQKVSENRQPGFIRFLFL